MGPLADLRFGPDIDSQQTAVRWVDNFENDKQKLVTNRSEDDLVYKEEPGTIDIHKQANNFKPCIKPFKLNMDEVTGVENFTMSSSRNSHR